MITIQRSKIYDMEFVLSGICLAITILMIFSVG